MKRLIVSVTLFSAVATMATVFVWWDTAPAKSTTAKYRLGQQENLGLIVYEPMKPGPAIWKFECISESEKDCEQQRRVDKAVVVNPVPEPGTLSLILLGVLGLIFNKFRYKQ